MPGQIGQETAQPDTVESIAIDQCLCPFQTKKPGPWVTGLRQRRYGTKLEKTKPERSQTINSPGVFIQSGCKSNRVLELNAHNVHRTGRYWPTPPSGEVMSKSFQSAQGAQTGQGEFVTGLWTEREQ